MRAGRIGLVGTATTIGMLAIVLTLASCGPSIATSPVPPTSATPTSAMPTSAMPTSAPPVTTTPVPSMSVEAHRIARIEYRTMTVDVRSTADCDRLGLDAFYREFCVDVLATTWSAIPVDASAATPSAGMLARLARASLDGDTSLCTDAFTISYIRLGSRGPIDDQAATSECVHTISTFLPAGTTIVDPTTTDNAMPLRISAAP